MRVVVIGVGNIYRGDDGAGPEVARLVRSLAPPSVEILESDGEAASMVNAWEGADLAIVVDAVHSHAVRRGHIHRMELGGADTLPSGGQRSSHGLGPGDAIALARALDRLPRRLIIYGIEGDTFDIGLDLSPEVQAAAEEVVERVVAEVKC